MPATNRRPKHSVPYELRRVNFNFGTNLYDITEQGINYHLTFEQFNDLKMSFSLHIGGRNTSIMEWYDNLNRFDKKKVKRTGDIREVDTGFYPDE